MCGIVGFWSTAHWPDARALAKRMVNALTHRGPDDNDVYICESHCLALGHTRLAVQDLSIAGHQPMKSRSGRYVVTFNGEIYNHASLRKDIHSESSITEWRGSSDTETLVAAFDCWGIKDSLIRLNGMFALAVYDHELKQLVFARDRLGEKPLYVGRFGHTVLFSSELSALHHHPAFTPEICRDALSQYMARSTVPAPRSIYKHVYKIPAGHSLTLSHTNSDLTQFEPYWSLAHAPANTRHEYASASDASLADQLFEKLQVTVHSRMLSDAPLGAFLSGGIDSSLVVAMMQQVANKPVKTFTIGFSESDFDEAPFARAVARHLGTDHSELYMDGQQARDLVPLLPTIFDEPFADSSQIPTTLLSQFARQSVTVCLSGDGGDELFGGYQRYQDALRIAARLKRLPYSVRTLIASLYATTVDPAGYELSRLLPENARSAVQGQLLKAQQSSRLFGSRDAMAVFDEIVTYWNGSRLLRGCQPIQPFLVDMPDCTSELQRMMFHDTNTYLPDTLMTKIDRASMSAGLEVRAPLLDHELVEFAWQLPDSSRLRNGKGKWLLREVLGRFIPPSMIDRPKTGFGVPLDQWFRGPLREWAENLLSEERLDKDGLFNTALVRRIWELQLKGRCNAKHRIWNVLMFQAWMDYETNTRLTTKQKNQI